MGLRDNDPKMCSPFLCLGWGKCVFPPAAPIQLLGTSQYWPFSALATCFGCMRLNGPTSKSLFQQQHGGSNPSPGITHAFQSSLGMLLLCVFLCYSPMLRHGRSPLTLIRCLNVSQLQLFSVFAGEHNKVKSGIIHLFLTTPSMCPCIFCIAEQSREDAGWAVAVSARGGWWQVGCGFSLFSVSAVLGGNEWVVAICVGGRSVEGSQTWSIRAEGAGGGWCWGQVGAGCQGVGVGGGIRTLGQNVNVSQGKCDSSLPTLPHPGLKALGFIHTSRVASDLSLLGTFCCLPFSFCMIVRGARRSFYGHSQVLSIPSVKPHAGHFQSAVMH